MTDEYEPHVITLLDTNGNHIDTFELDPHTSRLLDDMVSRTGEKPEDIILDALRQATERLPSETKRGRDIEFSSPTVRVWFPKTRRWVASLLRRLGILGPGKNKAHVYDVWVEGDSPHHR